MKENKPSPEASTVLVNGSSSELTNNHDGDENHDDEDLSPDAPIGAGASAGASAAAAVAAVVSPSPILPATKKMTGKVGGKTMFCGPVRPKSRLLFLR